MAVQRLFSTITIYLKVLSLYCLLEKSVTILKYLFLIKSTFFIGMVDQQISESSSVIRHAQDLGCKHSLGIISPHVGPVPVSISNYVTGLGGQ